MKKKIVISLLLILSFISSMIIPIKVAKAGNGNEDNGMVIDKTVTANADGSYTITLEAYATGELIITPVTQDVPTDIILVLDQSGSMDYDFNTYSYSAYSPAQSTNSQHYSRRNNGGTANLWYQLNDGSYVPVNVARQEVIVGYDLVPNNRNRDHYDYEDRLYEYNLVDDEYRQVILTRTGTFFTGYTYTYTFFDNTVIVSEGRNTRPDLGSHAPLYYAVYGYSYTYSYVDNNGVTQTIGTSIGDNTQFETTLYQRVTTVITRLEALQNAVTNFANAVAVKAAGPDGDITTTEDNVNHRIAIVGYASRYDSTNPWINTELFIGATQYNYNVNASNYYGSAFQNMDTLQGQNNVAASINVLDGNGATYTNYGMIMANGILNANPIPAGEQRNQIIIVFTDGIPGRTGWDGDVADAAIAEANIAKGNNVEVYSIGIFDGADSTSAGNQNGTETQRANWFMQNLSSNNGVVQTPSYYLSAGDSEALNNIFQQISEQIEEGGSSTTLNEEAIIKDIIAPAFTLPEGTTASDITLETWRCTGKEGGNYTWLKNSELYGAQVVLGSTNPDDPTTTNNHLSITGFDFSEHYVGTVTEGEEVTYRGNKLVIKFNVKPRPGFLGGNGVETNTSAGVYENASATDPILTFPKPIVDVAVADINITTPSEAKNVYLLHDVTFDNIHEGITVKIGTVSLDLGPSAVNWGLQPWQNEYLDIAVTYSDANGNPLPLEGWQNITEDMMYSVTVTIQPKKTGTIPATGSTQTGNTAINVFKPELNFKDISVYYGDNAPTDSGYAGSLAATLWKHGSVLSTDVTMIGDAPVLDLTYTPEAGKISAGKINTKQDIKVDVAVAIGTTDVMEYTTFVHTPCDPACGWNEPAPLDGSPAFLLHVNTCSLTITKGGGVADESYVFDILKDGTKYSEVTIWGNGSKTIYELPVGNYTIQENTGWSWRYTANNGSGVNLNAGSPTGSIACLNTKSINKWLNGYSPVVTNIFGVSH